MLKHLSEIDNIEDDNLTQDHTFPHKLNTIKSMECLTKNKNFQVEVQMYRYMDMLSKALQIIFYYKKYMCMIDQNYVILRDHCFTSLQRLDDDKFTLSF